MKGKTKSLLYGIGTFLPGVNRWFPRRTGGTDSPRYCYSVWLRHLVMAQRSGLNTNPRVVAELGPGDSLGIGLAAVLSGAEQYYAFDAVEHASTPRNVEVLEGLIALFEQRADLPGEDELPEVGPKLETYQFPAGILSSERLQQTLDPRRLERIRESLVDGSKRDSMVQYMVPWDAAHVIAPGSVDMVLSQAVLEHIDDLPGAYRAMGRWLKPTGFMSHDLDFRCHRVADAWNGHWTYSDFVWKLFRGKRPYLINREPYSTHLRLLAETGFEVKGSQVQRAESSLSKAALARRFRHLSEEDLTTSGAFIQAVPA